MADDPQVTVQLVALVGGAPTPLPFYATRDSGGNYSMQSTPRTNGAQVDDTNSLPIHTAPGTPAVGPATVIAVSGTAVVAIIGPARGGYIINPETAADQNIAAIEALYVDPVGNCPGGAVDGCAFGSVERLDPGQRWVLPFPLAAGQQVHVNGFSAQHRFTVVTW